MRRFRTLLQVLLLVGGSLAIAQTTAPVTVRSLPPQVLVAGAPGVTLNLAASFGLADVAGQIIQFDTVSGRFDVELFNGDVGNTVANFLGYVQRGDYRNALLHRSLPGTLIHGGGYRLDGFQLALVPKQAAIKNEFRRSNIRGTLAMAKPGSGPDTATSQWFVNLEDNGAWLDHENGGYTVFGRVLSSGMAVVDQLGSIGVYDKSAQLGSDFSHLPLLQNSLEPSSFALVRSISLIPVYPDASGTVAALRFAAQSANPAVVDLALVGSSLSLVPQAPGASNITVEAIDTGGAKAAASFTVTVMDAPIFTSQPAPAAVAVGGSARLAVAATGAPAVRWQRNGLDLSGASGAELVLTNVVNSSTGLYAAIATIGSASVSSEPAIVGLATESKVLGAARETASDIALPNGNVYDQVLLQGVAATVTNDAEANHITRLSYLDLNDDIVQVEFSGPGALSIVLEEQSGPELPAKYNQNARYMKGHAGIVVAGATAATNLTVYSVGRQTASNGSLFNTGVEYDGVADLAFIAISSADGAFGALRAGNVRFFHVHGQTGVYAPGVAFRGPVFVGDIRAFEAARPVLRIGSAPEVRITGGALAQPNGQPVHVEGVTQLRFTAGVDSHGIALPAQVNRAALRQGETDVTASIVLNPP